MLVVRLELWPGGSEKRKKVLGTVLIANDGTGTHNTGNYKYSVFGQHKRLKYGDGVIKDYRRQRHHPWRLVWEALDKMFKERGSAKQANS